MILIGLRTSANTSADPGYHGQGFGYEDCEVFEGDSIRHEIRWNGRSLNELARQTLRIDFYLQDADLFTFVAGVPFSARRKDPHRLFRSPAPSAGAPATAPPVSSFSPSQRKCPSAEMSPGRPARPAGR